LETSDTKDILLGVECHGNWLSYGHSSSCCADIA
jgi:hypothetical protein